MSRTADKHNTSTAASAGVVSPPPSLAANGARHRSGANYAQSYGRSSFEQQQHKFKQPLQPAPHESLRSTHSKSGLRVRQAPSSSILADVSISDESEDGEEGVDVSAMTTPAQSYVPEARRRGVPATSAALSPSSPPHTAPAAAAVKPMERNADKENTNVVVGPAAPVVVVAAAHSRPTLKSAPATAAAAASASSSASPAVLYRRTPSGVRGGGGGGSRVLAPGAASNTSPTTAAPSAPVLKRTTSLKAHPATAGARKVSAVSPSPQKQPQQQEQQRSTSSPPTSSALDVAYTPSAAVAEPSSPPPKQPPHTLAAAKPAAISPVDWEVQVQLDKAEAVLCYVSEVARALSERRRCGPPPDSTDDFRASVVPCRRSPGLSTTQQHGPEAEGGGRSGVVSGQHADASVALLPDLHRTAGALLSAFTRLEYAQLSDDVDLPLLESESVQRSAQLRRLVDGVARQLALHELPDVRQRLAQRRDVFTSFHAQVDFIARMAQQVVLLRGIAAHRDLAEAREVLDSFTRSVEQQEAEQRARDNENNTKSTDAHGASAFRFSPLRMLQASPFFEWLDARWFPTMRAWRRVVVDARQLASTGETDAALRRSRQAALQVAGLHELLRPGETVASLHHEEVVVPVTELGNSFAQKRAVLDELRSVISEDAEGKPVDVVALAKALKSAQAFAQVRSGRPTSDSNNLSGSSSGVCANDDMVLVRAAEDLLRRVQEVRRVRDAIAVLLQTPSPALTALLEHITRVNELVMNGHLARDDVAARAALEAGRLALGRGAETADSVSSGRTSAASGATAAAAAWSARNTPHRPHHPQPEVPPLDFDGLTQSPPPPSQQSSKGSANRWIGDGFPVGFDVHSLYIPHTTAPSWPSDLDVLYRESCDVFCMLFVQRQAQRQLELALGHSPAEGQGRSLGGAAPPQPQHNTHASIGANGFTTPSPQITPRRPTRDVGTPATAKTTATTNRSSEEGSPATLTTARSSGCDGGRDGFSAASGPSADELRRRIQQAEDAGVDGSLVEEARARLRRLLTVRLKIHFDAQTRVLPIADAAQADFTAVYAQVHAHCQSQLAQSPSSASPQWAERRLRIRYEDSDGDFISLLTQQDWDVMLAEMQGGEGTSAGGKVELFCDYLVQPNTPPPPALPSADNASSPHRGEGGAEAGSGQDTSNPHHQHQGHEEGNEAANTTTTPEKQPDVFARLAASKEVTPVAHGGRGGGGGGNRTPRGRARLGGPSPGSSPQQALIPRTRNAASGIAGANGNRQGTSSPAKLRPAADAGKSPSSKGQANAVRRGEGVSSATGGKKASPHAVLTAENLRRNLFRSSPSPPSTEGRRSGGGGGAAERTEGNAGRSSGSRGSATSAHQAPPPPSSSSAVAAKTPQQTQQKQGDAAANVAVAATAADDSPTATRVVEKNPPAARDASSSAVRLDLDGARRWVGAEGAEEDELQLLEIQTRASISTVRLDPYVSTSSFDLLPSSSAVTATARQQQQQQQPPPSSGRNTFTTSHCSRTPPANTEMPPSPTSPGAAAAAAAGTRKGRMSQSPPRRAARRWTSDDFSLDEVETVCSERSRLAMQPAVPRGPTTLPPRPQTSAGANRTPQRVRRGARGTPTRSRTDAEGGEDDAAWAESVDDVFAEMQRMREENSKAMGQPRKAAWH